jgi:hypothetical protein
LLIPQAGAMQTEYVRCANLGDVLDILDGLTEVDGWDLP